jgi:TRAP-type mannitol/chloroaromatic compound transport system substrate-binding protein
MTEIRTKRASRRGFLKTAAAGGAVVAAGSLAAPQVSRAQTVTWRFQSTWPARDINQEYANDYVRRVNDMGGGRLRLDMLPAGAVVPAFQLIDAVHAGTLDGGHGVTAYWFGRNRAFSLFGTAPPWFRDANNLLAWYYYGGGEALYAELLGEILRMNVVSFLTGPIPSQPLGWFRTPIERVEQLRGLKFRTVGLATDLFNELGAAVTAIPAGEIVPALERGVIDAAEFSNPTSDRILGFQDVAKNYMLQSFHQHTEALEIMFNKPKFDALAAEQKAIIRHAAEAASSDMSWKLQDRYPKDLVAMAQEHGVRVLTTPRPILEAQLAAWDRVVARFEGDTTSPHAGPFFKKVTDSQREWCRLTGTFFLRNDPPTVLAFNHFFGRA